MIRTPIYEECPLTKAESEVILLAQALRHKFTDSALESNLRVIDCHLPKDIHGSKYLFLQSFPTPTAKEYYYCSDCEVILNFEDSERTNCEKCSIEFNKSAQRQAGHYFLYSPLKDQLIQLIESKYFSDFRKENLEESDVISGKRYCVLRDNKIIGDNDITIQFNVDGVKTFESSKRSIWVILVQVNELPYRLRKDHMMCCGIWFDSKKPPMDLFLKYFINELSELHETGFEVIPFLQEEKTTIKVHTILASADAPARCAMQNLKQYNGENGCNYCLHPGVQVPFGDGFHRVYPGDKHRGRTYKQHNKDVNLLKAQTKVKDINGVKGPSVVMLLPLLHIIWSFPPEALHNIFEGVTKMFTDAFFDSKNHAEEWYLGKKIKEINELLMSMKPPSEVTRCPRLITQRSSWKASEWKNFLLYYSLVCFQKVMPHKKYYQHWFLFVYSVQIFMKTKITESEFIAASAALRLFVLQIESLYGIDFMSYNVHCLLHVPQSVQNFGALWAWSTFPYESYNGVLKGLFKGSQYVPDQILKFYARLKYLMLSSSVFGRPGCSAKGKALFQTLMKECKVRRAIKYGENLTAFGAGHEFVLTDLQKLLIEQFLGEEINIAAWCYDRFIYKHTLFHSSSCTALVKRLNCVTKTEEGNFLSIKGLLRIESGRRTYSHIVLGSLLEETNEILCENDKFSSSAFSTIVQETENIHIISPENIGKKCICIPYSTGKWCVMPLVNIVETD